YWRLNEFAGSRAIDSSGQNRDGFYEPGVVFYLEGPRSERFCDGARNRAAHFAGGRLETRLDSLGDRYSVSLWIWNGMPVDARPISGWFFSRGRNHAAATHGDHLGVGGTSGGAGRLVLLTGSKDDDSKPLVGATAIERWTWNHVLFVRDGGKVRVYLNGKPEIEAEVAAAGIEDVEQIFFGGRCDNGSNWEGRLDEIAVFDRALTAGEATALSLQD